ncbi:MAG: gamma-glutamyl-gamma-aminobutyrate hydrolase family protein [Polaromonas sp.]|nr:gamma-glutamyl-gamma-aminobutyrate hydrolase family protein [Polaromonas sp.]
MPLTLVVHTSTQPALYGAMAAVAALSLGDHARLMHLPATFLPADGADAVQHVAAEGELVPSGLLWFERLTGRPVPRTGYAQAIVEAAAREQVVVPWHPPVQAAADFESLLSLAQQQDVTVRLWQVEELEGRWRLRAVDGDACPDAWWHRDALGRLAPEGVCSGDAPHAEQAVAPLRIAVIGTEFDQRGVYPANLASLADAAGALGLSLDIRFVDPQTFRPAHLQGVDGVVLPGGSDMGNVAGQLAVAQQTLQSGVPTMGLCLGMQTMSTALVRSMPGLADANLAEADPDAPVKSFVPLAATPGLPVFRVGDQPVTISDPVFRQWLGEETSIRCNHRFGLNPLLVPRLREQGVSIAAVDASGLIVDAIRKPAHPFYAGMQGHPELGSRPDTPHPLMMAFLRAAAGKAGQAA